LTPFLIFTEYFASIDVECTCKYIDPSYMVRSVPANAADSLYCMTLAQNAVRKILKHKAKVRDIESHCISFIIASQVHGAMAGFTGFSTGLVNNRVVYLPIPQLVSTSPRSLNPNGQTWERILAMTGQPNTVGDEEDNKEEEKSEAVIEFPPLPEPTMT